jgi:hypothetical protein
MSVRQRRAAGAPYAAWRVAAIAPAPDAHAQPTPEGTCRSSSASLAWRATISRRRR